MGDIEKLNTKTGDTIVYDLPKDGNDITSDNKDGEKVTLQCVVTKIMLTGMPKPGYNFKFEKAILKKENLGSRKHLPCTFQFKYNFVKGMVIGEYTDNLVDDLLSDNEYDQSQAQLYQTIQSSFVKNNDEGEAQAIERPNYAEGIKTMRFYEGRLVEHFIDDDSISEDFEDDKRKSGFMNRTNKDDIDDDFDENF